MLKRRFVLMSAVLIGSLALSACGSSSAEPTATPAVAEVVTATEVPVAESEVVEEVVPTEAAETEVAEAGAPAEEASAEAESVTEITESTEAPAAELATTESAAAVTRTFVATAGNGSTAQYAVEEEFFGQAIPFVTAVGTTDQVNGSLTLLVSDAGVSVADGSFTVDLSTLSSDQNRRDNAIRRDYLESSTYPNATFTNIAAVDLPADATEGEEIAFQLTGDLTVREIAQPVTWDVTAKIENGTLTGSAVTTILMADYGFEAPNIAGMLKVTDGVTVTLNLVATEQ